MYINAYIEWEKDWLMKDLCPSIVTIKYQTAYALIFSTSGLTLSFESSRLLKHKCFDPRRFSLLLNPSILSLPGWFLIFEVTSEFISFAKGYSSKVLISFYRSNMN